MNPTPKSAWCVHDKGIYWRNGSRVTGKDINPICPFCPAVSKCEHEWKKIYNSSGEQVRSDCIKCPESLLFQRRRK